MCATRPDLARFLADIEQVLTFFRDEIGGRFTTLSQVYAQRREGREAA